MKKGLAFIKITLILMLAVMIAVVCSIAVMSGAKALTQDDFQAGTESAPCEIATPEDLVALSKYVNAGNAAAGKYFVLIQDIDLSGIEFTPIGSAKGMFGGIFDGNGYNITLNIAEKTDYVGIFGVVGNSGEVRRTTVSGSVAGGNFVGAIAGLNYGIIEDCINLASVGVAEAEKSGCGGIAGENLGTVRNCVNNGRVTVHFNGGGITGRSASGAVISACVNLSDVAAIGSGGYNIGGIVGENAGSIADCYNFAAMQTTGSRNSVGSAIGFYTSDKGKNNARVYNILGNNKSSRPVVGTGTAIEPDTFAAVSSFKMLYGKERLFSDDTLIAPVFEEGYGYLNCPEFVIGTEHQALFGIGLFAEGDGKEESPFIISDIEEWRLFENNSELYSYEDKYVKLTQSFDLGTIKPLFSVSDGFKGSFDGGENTLKFVTTATDGAGLFLKIGSNGTVKNLIADGKSSADSYAGILTAYLDGGKVSFVTTKGSASAQEYVGGIAAKIIKGAVSDCTNEGTVSGIRYVGGIAGAAYPDSAERLINLGNIGMATGYGYSFFGGIFGQLYAESISEAVNVGAITSRAMYAGGIVGFFTGEHIKRAATIGNVTGSGSVGGIVGYAKSDNPDNGVCSVSDSLTVATVTGSENVGGINGQNGGSFSVEDSYFSGRIDKTNDGGVVVVNETFYAIAPPSSSVTNTYYNSDFLGIQPQDASGVGAKKAVEFTELTFSGDAWEERVPLIESGILGYDYLPILKSEVLAANKEVFKYEYFDGGDGEGTPFGISGEMQLANLMYLVNKYEEYRQCAFIQKSDIAFTEKVEAIGKSGFQGSYDGNGYLLSNVDYSDGFLFDKLNSGALIKDVAVISGSSSKSGLANIVNSGAKIDRCYSLVNINGQAAGGLALYNNFGGEISRSFFAGRITGSSGSAAGGIVYENRGKIVDCFVSAYIVGETVGGIVARNIFDGGAAEIDGCIVAGTLDGISGGSLGGFAGKNTGVNLFKNGLIMAVISVDKSSPTGTDKVGAFVGESGALLNFSSDSLKFNSDYAKVQSSYFLGGASMDAIGYAVSSEISGWKNRFINSTSGKFGAGPEEDGDSEYAPVNVAFLTSVDEMTLKMSAEASKIRIYGWNKYNDNGDIWGGENNPYLIENVTQMRIMRERVEQGYDYTGKYFELTSNLNMGDLANFSPIGKFVATASPDNRRFNAVFDGKGHVISNLQLNDSFGSYAYLALFSNTGANFVLKNLNLDATCEIVGSQFVSSFAAHNNGSILHCHSEAVLIGENVGGIVAYTANNTSIIDTVFSGSMEGESVYGITAQEAGSVRLNAQNSWYAVPKDGGYVESGIRHNEYGNLLFNDRHGLATVSYFDENGNYIERGFLIKITADDGYRGVIMTTGDFVIYASDGSDEGFNPLDNPASYSKLFARFTVPVETAFTGFSDKVNNADDYGNGYYYEGQDIKFTYSLEYGYFIDDDPYYDVNEFRFGREDEKIVLRFNVPSLNSDESKVSVPVDIKRLSDYAQTYLESGSYDGSDKEIRVDVEEEYEDKFGDFNPTVYYGREQSFADSIKHAGDYTVKWPIVLKEHYVGMAVKTVGIAPAALMLNESADWGKLATKSYDGSKTAVVLLDWSYFIGVVEGDKNALSVEATVTWADASVGQDISTDIGDFITRGGAATDYVVQSDNIQVSGVINRRRIIVSVDDDKLSGEYSGKSPVLGDVVKVGAVSVRPNWARLTEDGQEDSAWNKNTWDVGEYKLTFVLSEADSANNYLEIEAECGYYVYVITPKQVTSIKYSDSMFNLVYNGTDLSQNIVAQYTAVTGGKARVQFIFYLENGTQTDVVVDAGKYIAHPRIIRTNYVLSESASEPREFTVARMSAKDAPSLELKNKAELEATELFAGGADVKKYLLEFNGLIENDDVMIKAEIKGNSRASLEVEKEDGKYYLVVARFSGIPVTFSLHTFDSKNYEDRYTEEITVTLKSTPLYFGLSEKSSEMDYGNIPVLEMVYSFDEKLEHLLTYDNGKLFNASGREITGFIAPICDVAGLVLNVGEECRVSFYGGSSDAYELKPVADRSLITVKPRKITVYVTEDKSKIYGETDPTIDYSVFDGEDAAYQSGNEMTVLPNKGKISLKGALGRESGEDVKENGYNIVWGTLNSELNPNFSFSYVFNGKFRIEKRKLLLVIDAKEKEYGMPDPTLTYHDEKSSDNHGNIIENSGFAFEKDREEIYLEIERVSGEALGEYAYRTNYPSHPNYTVSINAQTNAFTIVAANPEVLYEVGGELSYGDEVGKLSITGDAFCNGVRVYGKFVWENPNYVLQTVGENTFRFRFIPNSENYAEVVKSYAVNAAPREAVISFSGIEEYVYNGERQCDLTPTLLNKVDGDEVELKSEIIGNPVKAGKYTYKVTLDDPRYVIKGGSAELVFVIYKAPVTVTFENMAMQEGESFKPIIKYEGFVGGDDESVLKTRATVTTPTTGGVHFLVPSGASADNYIFNYVGGTLTVKKTTLSSANVVLNGDIGPLVNLNVSDVKESALSANEKRIDKALKHNVILPNTNKLIAYYSLDFNLSVEGDIQYTVNLNLSVWSKIYLTMKDGTVKELKNYDTASAGIKAADENAENATGSSSGMTITFTDTQIAGIAVYGEKSGKERIVGYLPLVGVCAGALFTVCIILTLIVERRKRDKRRVKYLKKFG